MVANKIFILHMITATYVETFLASYRWDDPLGIVRRLFGLRSNDPEEGVVLTHVECSNWTYEPQIFHLIVTYGDSIVHWAAHEVEPRRSERYIGATTVEIERPEKPGAVGAYARVDDHWQALDVDTETHSGKRITGQFEYGRRDETIETSTVRTADLQSTADT